MNIGMTSKNPRDWVEDFPHENGMYFCRCFKCKEQFMGHKRRVICKLCEKLISETKPPTE